MFAVWSSMWMLFNRLPIRSPSCPLSLLYINLPQWRSHSMCWLATLFKGHVQYMSSTCRQLPTASRSIQSCNIIFLWQSQGCCNEETRVHKFFKFWLIQPPVTFLRSGRCGCEMLLGCDKSRTEIGWRLLGVGYISHVWDELTKSSLLFHSLCCFSY